MALPQVTDSSFKEDVLNVTEKHVLVDFWAEWCGPCRMLAPVLEAIDTKFTQKLSVVKLNTDENSETAQQFQITGIPCCILFKNGEEVARIVGYKSEAAFETELSQHIQN
ncbi:MAG: thioredoxin 1 [Candidatus Marinamargulisbacteria bacterium]|jgi:thioredoxin 1